MVTDCWGLAQTSLHFTVFALHNTDANPQARLGFGCQHGDFRPLNLHFPPKLVTLQTIAKMVLFSLLVYKATTQVHEEVLELRSVEGHKNHDEEEPCIEVA
jgi:hypothetical protein